MSRRMKQNLRLAVAFLIVGTMLTIADRAYGAPAQQRPTPMWSIRCGADFWDDCRVTFNRGETSVIAEGGPEGATIVGAGCAAAGGAWALFGCTAYTAVTILVARYAENTGRCVRIYLPSFYPTMSHAAVTCPNPPGGGGGFGAR